MIKEIVSILSINPVTFELQEYSFEDISLISTNQIEVNFEPDTDYLEYYIYDLNNNIIFSNIFGYPNFTLLNNQVTINPENDLRATGNIEGQYNTLYNFLRRKLASSPFQKYFIQEISSDRTEIRLDSTTISNSDIIATAVIFEQEIQNAQGNYLDFYLNFGDNQLVIANNILLDNSNPNNSTVLIKLYEALPLQFDIKSECWVVEQIAESVAYNINISTTFDLEDDSIQLRGPNLNISINDAINNSTNYATYNSLTSSSYGVGSASLEYQINSILAERGIKINVDYSDYTNFIYLSSAQTRLENFYYKLQLIEEYTYSASLSQGSNNSYVTSSQNIWQAKINEIITTFDGYDYYLYYESGSTAWPKTNATYPYTNTSSINPGPGYTWFISQSTVAEEYDRNNNNSLINAIPNYLREDTANAEYELFVEMLGEMFDNIWIYYQDVTNKWNTDNRLQYGVSKNLVADILRDLGIKIYESSFGSTDLYTGLLGLTQAGNQFPFPDITGSLPTPSGLEYIKTKVSASSNVVPLTDVEKSFYKRLYHNLPLLLKKKGTTVGLQNLITSYGIPNTILRINEYGNKDKDNSNDWDYWYDQYNYTYTQLGNNFISSSWSLNSAWASPNNIPATLMFRFKTNGLPTSNIPRSQSLWSISGSEGQATIILTYTGSGYTSASYSGSIIDPYYQYAKLDFIPNIASLNTSASVYLPFFNGDWWSVMLTSGSNFTLYSKNSIYRGYDGNQLGFQASSSVAGNNSIWVNNSNTSFFGTASLTNYKSFSGSFQEIRYYNTCISESVFDDYVMNPNSVEGNGINQGPNQLAFRASLGGELYTGSTSIHPKVTGSWAATSSFTNNSSNFSFNITPIFVPNTQSIFFDQPPVGIKNSVADKIKQQDITLPYSSSLANIPNNTTLSPFKSIQQDYAISQSYTKNINYTEVAFSPQNEINDDINSQIGYINIGEYIGDPRLVSSSAETYPPLDALRNAYFEKYTHNYDINDYIRLIKYFDNSLFKMIKDFTPARASLASGIVVKQHLLERNKYPVPQATPNTPIAYYGSGSENDISWNTPFTFQNLVVSGAGVRMHEVTGSTGGVFPNLNGLTSSLYIGDSIVNITQSWSGTTPSKSGSVPFTQSSQIEFFNGELSGSNVVITNGELNEDNLFKLDNYNKILFYIPSFYKSGLTDFDAFFNSATTPPKGEMYLYWDNNILSPEIGVKYIKLAKKDNNDSDNDEILGRINTIIIPSGSWEDSAPFIEYDIIGISNYGEYYLYNTTAKNATSSIYNQIKEYPVSASSNIPVTVTYPTTSLFKNYNILAGTNTLKYFETNSGLYKPSNTPNVPIIFTASVKWNNGSNEYIAPKIVLAQGSFNNYITISSSVLYGQDKRGGTIYLSGSFSPIEDQTYFIGLTSAGYGYGAAVYGKGKYGISSETITFASIQLLLTQSFDTQSVLARKVIADPFIPSSFQNSDYNILLNNIITNRPSSFYMKLDEINSQVTASNLSLILNKSALKASVPDYYYTCARQINSRYIGKELVSAKINSWEEGDIAYGKEPNIRLLKTHFIYFNSIGISAPEWGNVSETKTNVNIKYIVNENGSLIKPINDAEEINLSIIQRSFNQNAILALNSDNTFGTNLSSVNGTWSVFKAGQRISPILHTQTASYDNNGNIIGFGYTGSIDFVLNSLYTASCNSFWVRDLNAGNIIYADTTSPTSLYNFVGWRQVNINNPKPSGFDPITLNFLPQPLDEIRFEGTEDYAYTIISVSTSSGTLELVLNDNIPSNVNLDYFLLRRYINDPSNIILNLNKPAGASSEGVLKPEYITPTLEDSIIKVIEKIQSTS